MKKSKKNFSLLKISEKKNVCENIKKFINLLMKNGNKCKAYSILYNALNYVYVKKKEKKTYTTNLKKKILKKNILKKTKLYEKIKKNKYINCSIFYTINKNFLKNKIFFYYKHILYIKQKQNNKFIFNEKLNIVYPQFYYKIKQNLLYLNNTKKRFIFSKNLLNVALNNVKPSIETKNVKVNGKIYIVPKLISEKKQNALVIRWIIDAAKKRKKNSNIKFYECLGLELLDALNKHGKVFQKRNDLHKLAELNRAYMRFRWW